MSAMNTAEALSRITDEGFFEELATAVLRAADPRYEAIVQTGVNAAGRTIRSPLDGICFERGAEPPHMVAVHHTTTGRRRLRHKWLHDPSPERGTRSSGAPAGDVIKTSEIVERERTRVSDLRVTLVLTATQEPTEDLVRELNATARLRALEIDLWPNSRLAHFLDNHPTGQWIRWKRLGIDQEQLSSELLGELSRHSLTAHRPAGDPDAWVPRAAEERLVSLPQRGVSFLVGRSGFGKSVACYRTLARHVESGGPGIVLPHEIVASSATLEQAISAALKELHPALAEVGNSPLEFCSESSPFLMVVEDVNRSGEVGRLIEKLVRWAGPKGEEPRNWTLLCPVWPERLELVELESRRRVDDLTTRFTSFTAVEGREAVLARAALSRHDVSELEADTTSMALGHDPLLIALHDLGREPDPEQTIGRFVNRCCSRIAIESSAGAATDYRESLRALAEYVLEERQLEPKWARLREWPGIGDAGIQLLGRLIHSRELIHLTGVPDQQRVSFRHDRIRDWLLAEAVAAMEQRHRLSLTILKEPHFAEVLGGALFHGAIGGAYLERLREGNPLALFHALRGLGSAASPERETIVASIRGWLDKPTTHTPSKRHLRWEALAALARTDGPEVPELVGALSDRTWSGHLARLRNGDVRGGMDLCYSIDPGVNSPWRDAAIAHAVSGYGRDFVADLGAVLERWDSDVAIRVGALRLAGHIGDPHLAGSLEAAWHTDPDPSERLDEYLWAFAQCCASEDPSRLLDRVCDAWAALPAHSGEGPPRECRESVAAHGVRWGFRSKPPRAAIPYFVARAKTEELRWPITYMLHGVDDTLALCFIVEELADTTRRMKETGSFSTFVHGACDDWRRAQDELGRPMSAESRAHLLQMWQNHELDGHVRTQAFRLWAATRLPENLRVLRAVDAIDDLADRVLRERLLLGDREAIPLVIPRLAGEAEGYWWQFCRAIWSAELTEALDQRLAARTSSSTPQWGKYIDPDWILSELVMRLPAPDAERLLHKHWDGVRTDPLFVQAALYVGSPSLLEAARRSIEACPDPAELLRHLDSRFGIKQLDHPGVTRQTQVTALAPYLHHLRPMEIGSLAEECNKHGWYGIRRELLDDLLQAPYDRCRWDADSVPGELDELLSEKRSHWMDHWTDDQLQTGVSWDELLETILEWLRRRPSIEALELAAAAVKHRGGRDDLNKLAAVDLVDDAERSQLLEDTSFAVRRRTLRDHV